MTILSRGVRNSGFNDYMWVSVASHIVDILDVRNLSWIKLCDAVVVKEVNCEVFKLYPNGY